MWKVEAEQPLHFFCPTWRPGCIVYASSEKSQPGLVNVKKLYTGCSACLLSVILNEREGKQAHLADLSWLRSKQIQ